VFSVQFESDAAAVQDSVDRQARRVMMRAGAFLRRRAISLLRRRKSPSRAGEPPSVHSTDARSLKNIRFEYDPAERLLVVGVMPLDGAKTAVAEPSDKLPNVLEFGGTVALAEEQTKNGRWRRVISGRQPHRDRPQRRRTVTVAPRPFMGPALDAEIPTLIDLWSE